MMVVIDTSIYRKDPKRDKAAFRALERLAKGKKLTVQIPEIVRLEFLSQQAARLSEELRAVESAASSLPRLSADEDITLFAEELSSQSAEILSRVAVIAREEFDTWASEVGAEIHYIADDHGKRVMDAYFSGAPPFKVPKNRSDIPDSFIWECILDLSSKHGSLHVVSSDGTLRDAADKQKGLFAYDSLESLVQSQECQQLLQQMDAELLTDNVARATSLLPQKEAFLREMVELELVSTLDGKTVNSRNIPDDNNEGMIISVNAPDTLDFSFEKVDYYGSGEMGLPFTASVVCTVNYAIFKSDYYCLSENKAERISIDERNEHYYDADEDYTLETRGILLISLKEENLNRELEDEDLRGLFEVSEYSIELDEIEVEGGEEF